MNLPAPAAPERTLMQGFALAFMLSLGVTVSNSFARMAYALVLPSMRADLGWNYTQSGWLNTANAIGYLIGAVLTRVMIRHTGNRSMFVVGVLATALTVLATGLTRVTEQPYGFGETTVWIRATRAPVFDIDGEIAGLVCVIEDISAERAACRQRADAEIGRAHV